MATKSKIQSIQRIENKDPDGYPKYLVKSNSGNTYTVSVDFTDVSYDHAQYGTPWGCNCPARGNCHHVTAVIALRSETLRVGGSQGGDDGLHSQMRCLR
jgi:hypothetical protein